MATKTEMTTLNLNKLPTKVENYKYKIVVVGSGAFGTAIAESLIRAPKLQNQIVLFGINEKEVYDINKNHKNSKFYSLKLSPKLYATTDPKIAFDNVDIVMLAIPSSAVKNSLEKTIIPNINKPSYFINLSKGFDFLNNDIISNVIKTSVPKELNLGTMKLAGASYATELIHKQPTWFVLAADDIKTSEKIYRDLSNPTMKITPMGELDAVEWLSIIKNPMAILHGVIAGLGFGVNTKALFFTQSINETRRILKFLGQNDTVIFNSAGIGDFFLTGTSRKSRNYSTGYAVGKADRVTKKVLQIFTTTEGLRSIEILLVFSMQNRLNLTIIELLYEITYNKQQPSKVIQKYLDNFQ